MNSLEAKVVILGAQGAGKTSLVVRFVENNFHRNQQSTIGASFLVKKVSVSLCFWIRLTEVDRSTTALCGYRFVVVFLFFYDTDSNRFGIQRDKSGFGLWYVKNPKLFLESIY